VSFKMNKHDLYLDWALDRDSVGGAAIRPGLSFPPFAAGARMLGSLTF
jgi:hypothetical protein